MTKSSQTTGGQEYKFVQDDESDDGLPGYVYNLAGLLTAVWYPSQRKVSYSHDNAGRITAATGMVGQQSTPYASQVQYYPHGAIKTMKLGNDLWESALYNTRLQPVDMKLGTATMGSQTWRLQNGYSPAACSVTGATECNNGNVRSQTLSVPGLSDFSVSFGYDEVNRLTSASETGGAASWSRNYGYTGDGSDGRFGNLTVAGTEVNSSLNCGSYDAETNECDSPGFVYDPAGSGNLVSYGGRSLDYDAENRQKKLTEAGGSAVFEYHYDGDGRRVMKVTNQGTTVYVHDAFGQLAAEYADHEPANQPECTTCYLTADHLGTTRVLTGGASPGAVVKRYDYYPFGGQVGLLGGRTTAVGYEDPGTRDWSNPKFTAKLRDYESGLNLDYFGARYYAGAMGRFTSPDQTLLDQDPFDPQSWNLYAYVRNNPVVLTDPDGRAVNFLAAAGAGIVGFGMDVGFQVFGEGRKLSKLNFRRSAGVGAATAVAVASFGILAPAATSATLVTVAGETSLQVGSTLALQTGPAVVSGVVGGAVGKVVETGDPSRALGNTPLEPVANGVGAVVGNVAQAAGNAVVGSTRATGALRELQRQRGRAQAPTLQRKLEGRISGRATDVAGQQRVANTAAQASTEAAAQVLRKRLEEEEQNR